MKYFEAEQVYIVVQGLIIARYIYFDTNYVKFYNGISGMISGRGKGA